MEWERQYQNLGNDVKSGERLPSWNLLELAGIDTRVHVAYLSALIVHERPIEAAINRTVDSSCEDGCDTEDCDDYATDGI